MSNQNASAPPLPAPKTSKPVSEALLNEKVRDYSIYPLSGVSRSHDQQWLSEIVQQRSLALSRQHANAHEHMSFYYRPGANNQDSGIARFRHWSSDRVSASPLASSFPYCYSSEERGQYGWELASEPDELGKRQTVSKDKDLEATCD
jgi:hypothetical protein